MEKPTLQTGIRSDARERRSPRQIVLIGFEGFQILDVTGPMEVFAKANHHLPQIGAAPFRYAVTVASPFGGIITSSSGLQVAGTKALADLDDDVDTLIVAGAPKGHCATWRREPV